MSPGIEKLLTIARQSGLSPASNQTGQWSKAYVYGFIERMPGAVRDAGSMDPSLDHMSYEGDPHNRPHEGFSDRKARIAIDFSRKN
jgi:hypothetical protein